MGDGAKGISGRGVSDRCRWALRLGPSLAALLLAMAGTAAAWADVPDPGPAPEGEASYCSPGQQPGEACITDDGDEGTCVDDEAVPCSTPPDYVFVSCYLCDEDCSVAAVGAASSAPSGRVAAMVLLVAGLLARRSRRPRG